MALFLDNSLLTLLIYYS